MTKKEVFGKKHRLYNPKDSTIKEDYQHKIDLINKILAKKFKTNCHEIGSQYQPKNDKARQDYERMRDIYQYRVDAINRLEKSKEEEELKKASNYEEMLKSMEKE